MKIVELNQSYLFQASQLVNSVFLDEDEEVLPARELQASLDPELLRNYQITQDDDIRSFQYYVAVSEHQVMGIIGLYELNSDFDKNDWIGWFCVDERYRGQRIGIQLLNYAVQQSKHRGKENLLLYTSTHENELKAQQLYDANEFHIIKTMPKDGYSLMYRQKKLNSTGIEQ
ncbi:GNAT family N-acetyltransferase [Paenibacillus sp. NPDC058174]|uniref:GNAT family N-acetyltransferase n=1 Tax=Paenibacillus sp. NPDC058174 TaxID=3346366 RepID=UPI0036DB9E59